jgi:hypothetical protein
MSKAAELANLIGNINAGGGGVNRNLIINGAMNVSQRGTSHAFAHDVTTNAYTLDRFFFEMNAMDELDVTVTQDSSVPSGQGFANSMKVDITTAESTLASDEFVRILQKIEAQNLQVLNYGTSDAKTTTLSFWVKSNLTGAFAVSMYEADGNRIIGSTYTISSANTWEKKTITFVGDTGGTINNDNGEGFWLNFCLATGSDRTGTDNSSWGAFANAKLFNGQVANITSSASNDFYLTGVQLEVGQNPTEFEHEPFERALTKCQRYYEILSVTSSTSNLSGPVAVGQNTNERKTIGPYFYKTEKRAAPTVANVTIGIDAGDTAHAFVFSTDTRSTVGVSTTSTDIGEADGLEGSFNITVDGEM